MTHYVTKWIVSSSLTQSVQGDLNGPPGQSLWIFLPIDEGLISRVLLACVCFWIHIDWFLTTWQKMKNIFISFAFKDFFNKHSFHFLTMKIFPALRCNNGRNIFSHFFPLLWPVGVLLLDLEGWGLKQYVSWSWNYSNIMR